MLKTLTVILFSMVVISSSVYATTPMEKEFLSMNWNIVTKEQILTLFNETLPNNFGEFTIDEILDYDLKDLNGDGIDEMIVPIRFAVTVDFVSVICKVGNAIKIRHFDHGYNFEDINKDGKEELLIVTPLLPYSTWTVEGGATVWYDIYQWDGSEFKLVNDEFPEFYKVM